MDNSHHEKNSESKKHLSVSLSNGTCNVIAINYVSN